MLVTFETKIKDPLVYPLLDAIADLYSHVEHRLFVDLYVKGRPLNELKREYLLSFGLTARQFNAISITLRGKVEAVGESLSRRIKTLERQIEATKKTIKAIEKDITKTKEKPAAKRSLRFLLHQKKRRLCRLQNDLACAQREAKREAPSLCFGSRRLFRAQFYLEENGYACHEQWLCDWQKARASQFVCLGSKDEMAGNQTSTLLPNGELRLRVPNVLVPTFGRWCVIHNVFFPYGQDTIERSLLSGQAITYRFLRRKRKKGHLVWYVQATMEREGAEIRTRCALGALGVDLNPNLLAVGRIDRFGNPVSWRHIPVQLFGRRREQVEATLGDAVADIALWAKTEGVPIVIEKLNFEEKKTGLREKNPRYARMLSAFAYRKFYSLLLSRAAREGVEVILVNPALTSVIGQVKFGPGYGLSSHTAAAVTIARRGLGFGERLRSRSALPLPARNRGRHVWSDWRRHSPRLRAKKVRGRCPSEGGRSRGKPLSWAAPAARQGPSCDHLVSAPGCDPPSPSVGRAVRPAS